MRFLLRSSAILLLIAVGLPGFLCAQTKLSANRAAVSAYERAGQEILANRYGPAIQQLQLAVQTDPNFAAAWQRLGDVQRLSRNFREAKDSYLRVIAIDPAFFRGTWLNLGESELKLGDYEASRGHLSTYLAFPDIQEATRKRVLKMQADNEFALQALKSPVPFVPVNLGASVNSAQLEYLPALTADEETLIFTRQTNQNEDFYISTKTDGKWGRARQLSSTINTPTFNEGAQCLSPDGRYLFFTGCNRPGGLGSCDIYLSSRQGTGWTEPFRLPPPVNSTGWESQPSISADGKTLYFVSSRANGLGGTDIWSSGLGEGGEWSPPVNLGPSINTPYDEQSPFIHPDGQTLYFSSNGWPGMGDKDLFVSRKTGDGIWSKPQNLGYPINTFGEEAGIVISSNGRNAYFNAVRDGGFGGQDLYAFELPEMLRPNAVTYTKGTVSDKKTKSLLGAEITITDLASGATVYEDASDEVTGGFLATLPAGKSYALHISKPGYLFHSENFALTQPQSYAKAYQLNVELEPIAAGSAAVMRNVFFDSGRFELLPSSRNELQLLVDFLRLNPRLTIEISGHTDNVGDERSNQLLSENRAKAVYSYLLAQKIPAARLSYAGYGESRPLNANGTEEERQLNRRTTFRITKI